MYINIYKRKTTFIIIMFDSSEKSDFKAEILHEEKWIKFYIINEDGEPYQLNEMTIKCLPESIKGLYVSNTIGYNPLGWFSKKMVSKKNVRFSKKS